MWLFVSGENSHLASLMEAERESEPGSGKLGEGKGGVAESGAVNWMDLRGC